MQIQIKRVDSPLPVRIPEDLRMWIEESRLIQLVLEAVWETQAKCPTEAVGAEAQSQFAPSLALLCFCYATGLLGSQEIQDRIYLNGTLQQLFDVQVPDESAIRHFRRHHRAEIVSALSRVLGKTWEERFGKPAQSIPGCAVSAEGSQLKNQLEEAILQTAEDRISRAIEADSMWLDD